MLARTRGWMLERRKPDVAIFISAGIVATIVLEVLATGVLHRWAYNETMPRLPIVGIGLLPLLQWLVIPPLVLWFARRQIDTRSPQRGARKATTHEAGSMTLSLWARTPLERIREPRNYDSRGRSFYGLGNGDLLRRQSVCDKTRRGTQRSNLKTVLGVNAVMLFVELAAGMISGSTALLSDSIYNPWCVPFEKDIRIVTELSHFIARPTPIRIECIARE